MGEGRERGKEEGSLGLEGRRGRRRGIPRWGSPCGGTQQKVTCSSVGR